MLSGCHLHTEIAFKKFTVCKDVCKDTSGNILAVLSGKILLFSLVLLHVR
jgi:hypothetical protein